jgi:hypothetical protein
MACPGRHRSAARPFPGILVWNAERSVVPHHAAQFPDRSGGTFDLGCIEQLNRRAGHDGADGVLIHELGVSIAAKQNGKIVKPGDDPLQFDTVHKENRYRRFAFPHVVQEHVLNILRFLIGHGHNPSFPVSELGFHQ